ncbi:class-III pyridoxal-phosphate-dependent aminotransferase [Sporosarcina sp. FSL K6-1508]|uniref:class-III pyridoxal-phosphate-dependent aminotransferase n=1 Tax=Sporosarcina sp. FSL K6-1508 TaxID=2921553 RepID=UPI0030FC3FD0
MIKNANYVDYLTSNVHPSLDASPVEKGEGMYFWDISGKKFLDFSSQTLNLLLGQCHPAVVDAVVKQAKSLTYVSSRFGSTSYYEACKLLVELAPPLHTRVNIKMCDGSDANETGIKIAKKFTGKSGIISFYKGHTGQTTQTLNIRGYGRDPKTLRGSNEDVIFVNPPKCEQDGDWKDTIKEIRDAVTFNKNIACILLDPIMTNAGLLVNQQTKEYLQEVQQICSEEGIVFILDENQSFGWVPSYFATTYFDISPDVITLGKGLSGGHPLAGVLVKEHLKDVLSYNEADFTNGGHPISCAATKATLTTLKNEDFDISGKENYIFKKMNYLISKTAINIKHRGVGLIHSLEIINTTDQQVNEELAKSIYDDCLLNGIFLRLYNNCLIIKPPIIVNYEQIDELFGVLETALNKWRN